MSIDRSYWYRGFFQSGATSEVNLETIARIFSAEISGAKRRFALGPYILGLNQYIATLRGVIWNGMSQCEPHRRVLMLHLSLLRE